MFNKSLQDVVKGIRTNKHNLGPYISGVISEIKTELTANDDDTKGLRFLSLFSSFSLSPECTTSFSSDSRAHVSAFTPILPSIPFCRYTRSFSVPSNREADLSPARGLLYELGQFPYRRMYVDALVWPSSYWISSRGKCPEIPNKRGKLSIVYERYGRDLADDTSVPESVLSFER
eukprot:1331088-Amorphochlora_amoeboformis.AAC.2